MTLLYRLLDLDLAVRLCRLLDVDVAVSSADIAFDVDDLTEDQAKSMNACATEYGMKNEDYLK